MSALYVEKVKRGDWNVRRAVRINRNPEEEGESLVERLPATAASDPLVFLLTRESAIDLDAKLSERYSQATAYAITFSNFNNDRRNICMHLVISDTTLYRRVASAVDTVKVQASMFDCIERIPATFIPLSGKTCAKTIEGIPKAAQSAWSF